MPKKTGGVKKGATQVSDEAKGSVVQLKHAGYSGNKIARALKPPRSTVYRIISVHAITGATERRKGSGRPRTTTMAEDERIILCVKRDRSTTSKEASARLKPTLHGINLWEMKKQFINILTIILWLVSFPRNILGIKIIQITKNQHG